jgi:hypothetical protein
MFVMKLIFNFVLAGIAVLTCKPGYSQRILTNTILSYIDDSFVETDTMLSKNNLTTAACYRCMKNNDYDSCVLVSQAGYDKFGRIIELTRGSDLINKLIDIIVSYKWFSDTTMESIAKCTAGQTILPGSYFVDTVINGRQKRMSLFKTDREGRIYIRSVYSINRDGFPLEIKRYDLNGKLVEIYFPAGNIQSNQNWIEVAVSSYDSIIISSWAFDNYINRRKLIYTPTGVLKEVWDWTKWRDRSDSIISRSVNYYDDNGKLIVKDEVDQNNRLLSETRLYYRNNKLIEYTSDHSFNDSLFDEQKKYNSSGQIIFSSDCNVYNGECFVFKYFYDDKKLLRRKEYYVNDELKYYQRYEYK